MTMLQALPIEMARLASLAMRVRETATSREEALQMMMDALKADISLRSLFYEQGREVLRFMDAMTPRGYHA